MHSNLAIPFVFAAFASANPLDTATRQEWGHLRDGNTALYSAYLGASTFKPDFAKRMASPAGWGDLAAGMHSIAVSQAAAASTNYNAALTQYSVSMAAWQASANAFVSGASSAPVPAASPAVVLSPMAASSSAAAPATTAAPAAPASKPTPAPVPQISTPANLGFLMAGVSHAPTTTSATPYSIPSQLGFLFATNGLKIPAPVSYDCWSPGSCPTVVAYASVSTGSVRITMSGLPLSVIQNPTFKPTQFIPPDNVVMDPRTMKGESTYEADMDHLQEGYTMYDLKTRDLIPPFTVKHTAIVLKRSEVTTTAQSSVATTTVTPSRN